MTSDFSSNGAVIFKTNASVHFSQTSHFGGPLWAVFKLTAISSYRNVQKVFALKKLSVISEVTNSSMKN